MRIITTEDIKSLGISRQDTIDWVTEAFLIKPQCQLPPKMSVHPRGNDFINTMPCLLPERYSRFGCKVVSRVKGCHPALKSELMLIDTSTGALTALVDCDWVTAARTGAVATLAITTLRRSDARVYAFIGLGVVGQETLEDLLYSTRGEEIEIRLRRYKTHAEDTIGRLAPHYPNARFVISESNEELVDGADVVVSAITDADGLLVEDVTLFKPGCLVVPIHTRGFQNCDREFDLVVADDTAHVANFRYFNEFRQFCELGDVISGNHPGRTTDTQRILAYNIGLGLHDVFYATRIEKLLEDWE
ncbi:MAG: ornithine cyclodeaminase [Pseudoflavonifractor sp.]|nr:ornithine cyclodeaminase [Alloprevotella sp.]MCM1116790.1 ornithine cyclodeaminase [Pseudoflavonifractor sp.]